MTCQRVVMKTNDRRRRLTVAACSTRALVVCSVIAHLVAGCGSGSDSNPSTQVGETTISVPSTAPPANPRTGTGTPPDLNRSYAEAYQLASTSDRDVQRVLILVPGFQGGAGDFRYMAQRVVQRTNGRTVVWAVDRRSNALEDQTGFDAAEAAANPDIAKDYYFNGKPIDGRTFAGFLDTPQNQTDISYMSEWGITTHIEDIDALVAEADRRYPHAPIFLGGHSLGGSIVPIYAAWNFGDHVGFERLSGLLLFEGTPRPAAAGMIPDQLEYETTGLSGPLGSVSLSTLRAGDPLSEIPFVSRSLFAVSEILAMRASLRVGMPRALTPDSDLFRQFFVLLFGLNKIPPMTTRAAFAFGFDRQFEPLTFTRASLGDAIGPIGQSPHANLFAGALGVDPATLLAPLSSTATYDWRSLPEMTTEPAVTDLDNFAEALFAGPSDFIEWYFPARLTLDVGVAASLNVQASGDWRREVYGMAVTENARVDLPVFAVAGGNGLVVDAANFGPYRDSISPILRNGSMRSESAAGFEAFALPNHAHLDVLTATDSGAADSEFGRLVSWMDAAVGLAPAPH